MRRGCWKIVELLRRCQHSKGRPACGVPIGDFLPLCRLRLLQVSVVCEAKSSSLEMLTRL